MRNIHHLGARILKMRRKIMKQSFKYYFLKIAAYLGSRKAIRLVAASLQEEKKYAEAIRWYKKILSVNELKEVRRTIYYNSQAEENIPHSDKLKIDLQRKLDKNK